MLTVDVETQQEEIINRFSGGCFYYAGIDIRDFIYYAMLQMLHGSCVEIVQVTGPRLCPALSVHFPTSVVRCGTTFHFSQYLMKRDNFLLFNNFIVLRYCLYT